jgi:hypothetical protein
VITSPTNEEWHFKLLKNDDPNPPWPKRGFTFKELAEMETDD